MNPSEAIKEFSGTKKYLFGLDMHIKTESNRNKTLLHNAVISWDSCQKKKKKNPLTPTEANKPL